MFKYLILLIIFGILNISCGEINESPLLIHYTKANDRIYEILEERIQDHIVIYYKKYDLCFMYFLNGESVVFENVPCKNIKQFAKTIE